MAGQGVTVLEGDGEDLDSLYKNIITAINTDGPVAVINHRPMCPGIEGLEGSNHGHDVISVKLAVQYLEKRGYKEAIDIINSQKGAKQDYTFKGSSETWDANRNVFGDAVVGILGKMSEKERLKKYALSTATLKALAA